MVVPLLSELIKFNNSCQYSLHTVKSQDPIIGDYKLNGIDVHTYNKNLLGYFIKLKQKLNNSNHSIYHGHGIWDPPIHQMATMAKTNNIPYVISPHGMLKPWSLKQSRLKKKLALKLYQFSDLKKANCLHATAIQEAESIRFLGLENPIAIIPNGIPIKDFPLLESKPIKVKKKLLYLSRIHYSKGIENLIEAWAKISDCIKEEWQIDIVGMGDKKYIDQLKFKVATYNLSHSINFLSPLYGENKVAAFQQADLFVLPTYTENFGIAIAESLASGTPVITTKGAPWEDLNKYKCGQWIDIGTAPLIRALEEVLRFPNDKLVTMGLNGRKLIEDKYSIDAVAKKMNELYMWLNQKGAKPEFVV